MVACAGLAGFFWFRGEPGAAPADAIVVENQVHQLEGVLPTGQYREFDFRLRNDSDQSCRVIGFEPYCLEQGCLLPKEGIDFATLPPHTVVPVPFRVMPYLPGEHALEVAIFVEDRNGMRRIPVTATWTAIAADPEDRSK
jgi:hypothetical protein